MLEYKLGDNGAIEEIFQRYKKPMLNYAFKLLRNFADAEDVVGEVFCVLTTRKAAYVPEAKFSTWLYTIAHNACIDRIRKSSRVFSFWQKKDRDSDSYEERDIPDTKFMPDIEAQNSEISRYIKNAVDKLPLPSREAIILRQYHNLTYEEISKVLNCSVGKVKVLIFRGRERLRKVLLPFIEEGK